jgi:hypothetical protein
METVGESCKCSVPRINLFEGFQELVLCSVPRTNLFVRVVFSHKIE